jgi:hypothetical protein
MAKTHTRVEVDGHAVDRGDRSLRGTSRRVDYRNERGSRDSQLRARSIDDRRGKKKKKEGVDVLLISVPSSEPGPPAPPPPRGRPPSPKPMPFPSKGGRPAKERERSERDHVSQESRREKRKRDGPLFWRPPKPKGMSPRPSIEGKPPMPGTLLSPILKFPPEGQESRSKELVRRQPKVRTGEERRTVVEVNVEQGVVVESASSAAAVAVGRKDL